MSGRQFKLTGRSVFCVKQESQHADRDPQNEVAHVNGRPKFHLPFLPSDGAFLSIPTGILSFTFTLTLSALPDLDTFCSSMA